MEYYDINFYDKFNRYIRLLLNRYYQTTNKCLSPLKTDLKNLIKKKFNYYVFGDKKKIWTVNL